MNSEGLKCVCGYTPFNGERLLTDAAHEWAKCPKCETYNICLTKKAEGCEPIHPLLNPDSKHYSMVDDVEAIVRMEQMYSVEDLMAWAKITAMKYRLRIGNKDDVVKEAKKIETYEAYYRYLQNKLEAK